MKKCKKISLIIWWINLNFLNLQPTLISLMSIWKGERVLNSLDTR